MKSSIKRFFKYLVKRYFTIPQENGEECFMSATDIALPEAMSCLGAKTFRVFPVGDTYYVKYSCDKDMSEFLEENFDDHSIDSEFNPPEKWIKEIPFWSDEAYASAHLKFYSKNHGEGGDLHWAQLSYNQESNIIYFVGGDSWN